MIQSGHYGRLPEQLDVLDRWTGNDQLKKPFISADGSFSVVTERLPFPMGSDDSIDDSGADILTSVVVEEISKESFRSLLHKRPELLGIMSRIIAERSLRLKLAQDDAKSEDKSLAGQLLDRMRSFFGHG